jgi:hypothetical protein
VTDFHKRGAAMSQTIAGHFDGKYIIPDGPVKLPIGMPLRIKVELARQAH